VLKQHPAAGDYICFRETAKQRRAYGIMAAHMSPIDNSGTYVVHGAGDEEGGAGQMHTIGRMDLHVAWLRLNNQDPSNHYKKDVPKEVLQLMYTLRTSNVEKFKEDIFKSKQEFDQELAKNFKLEAVRKAAKKSAASSTKTPPPQKVRKKCPKKRLAIGIKLAGFYLNKEVHVSKTKAERTKLRAIWKKATANDPKELKKGWPNAGDWYEGEVKGTRFNRNNDIVYVCKFITPSFERTLELDHTRANELAAS
jgi:hypothetical protein